MTLRLHRATLRHRTALPGQSWHSQVRPQPRQGNMGGHCRDAKLRLPLTTLTAPHKAAGVPRRAG